MNNFSAWVRRKLLEDQDTVTKDPIFYEYQCPLCKMKVEDEGRRPRKCGFCEFPMDYLGVVE